MATAQSQASRSARAPATDASNVVDGEINANQQDRHSPEVLHALEAERVVTLQGQVAELEATRSELQYDLNATLETLAQERKQSAVAEERYRAAEMRHKAEIGASEERLALAHADTEKVRVIAMLRQQLAVVERDNETLRERLRQLSDVPPLLEEKRQQLGELGQRLLLVVQDRKSLRRELQRRAQLLARARSELRASQKSVVDIRRSLRRLERDRWVLQRDVETNKSVRRRDAETNKALRRRHAETNKALRRQNAELAHLVDQLSDGFRAVLASRRWRFGSALSTVPRRLLFRPGMPAAPDAMLELVEVYRRRRLDVGAGFPSTLQDEALRVEPGSEDAKGGA